MTDHDIESIYMHRLIKSQRPWWWFLNPWRHAWRTERAFASESAWYTECLRTQFALDAALRLAIDELSPADWEAKYIELYRVGRAKALENYPIFREYPPKP